MLYELLVGLPESIAVKPVLAADQHEALNVANELLTCRRLTVVLKEDKLGN